MTNKHRIGKNFIALLSAFIIAFTMYSPLLAYAENDSPSQDVTEPTTQVVEQPTSELEADVNQTDGDVLLEEEGETDPDLVEDNRDVVWGWGNVEHTVRWEETADGVLTFTALDTASTDKEKAITRILDSDGNYLPSEFRSTITEVRIEEGITGLGWTALYNRQNNYQPQWPDDYPINTDETDVFKYFTNLETVKTCSTIKRIGWSAFRNCKKLTSIDFSTMVNLEEIMNQAFSPSALQAVDLSACKKLKTIGHGAFNFDGISSQTYESVKLPSSLETIGTNAFYHSRYLKYVIFEDISKVTYVGNNAFAGVNDGKLRQVEYIQDEATGQRAVVKDAVKELFSGVSNFPNGALTNTYLDGGSYWPLTIEVKEKTTDYNGQEQYGYEVNGVTGEGDDTCTVTGLVVDWEVSDPGREPNYNPALSASGYDPSTGTNAGSYDNGSFENATYEMVYQGYDYAINYNVTSATPGKLKIEPKEITITAKDKEFTYNGSSQSFNEYDVEGLVGDDAVTAVITGSITYPSESPVDNVVDSYEFTSGNPNNYTVNKENGQLTMAPKPITITAQSHEFTYTGEAQSWGQYDVVGLVGSDAISAVVTGSITYPSQSPVANVVSSYEFTSGDPDNYTVSKVDGELTMKNASVAITITSADDEWTYDGSAHENTEVTVTEGSLLPGDELVATATGSVTNVADTEEGNNTIASGYAIKHGDEDVTDNYVITPVAGTLTINPKPVTVTAASEEFTYNGTAQSCSDYTVDGLVGSDAITAVVTGSITFPSESPVENVVDSYEFTSGTAGNYTVEKVKGQLTMKKASATITITAASDEWTYDGNAHENTEVTVTYGDLFPGDELVATAGGSVTNVSDTYDGNNPIATGYAIMHGSENVTENYIILPLAGTLTIKPKAVTITAQSHEFTYNGTAQSWNQYDVEGLVGSDAISAVITGSITYPSESPVENVVDSYRFTTGDPKNYTVTKVAGELTMVNASNAITITSASDEWTYDGSAHENTEVEVTDGALFPGDELVATATGSVTDVADTSEGNNTIAAGYKIMNGDEDVTDNYVITTENGTLTIKAKAVTVTAQSHEFTYNGEAQSWDQYDVEGLVGSDAITAVVTGSITFPSESPVANVVDSYQFTTGDPDNYTVSKVSGQLTMVNASKAITITSATDEWTYDGSAHENTEVKVTEGELFPGDELVATATGSVTDVADTAEGNNTIASGYKIMNGDEDVTSSYVITTEDGTLTINPKAVKVTAESHEFTYSGTAQSWNHYDVDGLVGSDAISAVITGSITYPSESPVTNVVSSYEFTTGDAGNYTVEKVSGKLTMKDASVAITITSASDEWTYDGSAHENTEVTVTSGELLPGDELVATATGSVTNVSDTSEGNNTIANGYKIMNGDEDVTSSYVITTENGTLTIKAKAVTITAQSHEFTYNGTAQSWNKYDVEGLVGSDAISAVVTGSIKYPSESPVTNELASYEFTSGTPGNYTVTTHDGELTMVNAANEITITSATDEWTYDGNAHENTAVTVTSGELFPGDKLVATATGSVTNVSDTSEGNNTIAEGYKIMNGDEDVTSNYVITPENGTLTINPREVTVTITGNNDTVVYDEQEHEVTGYTYEVSDDLYTEDDFHADKEFSASGTLPDTYYMGISKDDFTNDNDNFDVTFVVAEDGWLEIEKALVKVIYKLNGGTYKGSKKDIVEEYAVLDVIKIHAKPTRKGYKFLYWKGSKYYPGQDYTVPLGGHTFVAIWEKKGDGAGTGDNTNMLGLLTAMTAAALGLFALVATRRRKEKK